MNAWGWASLFAAELIIAALLLVIIVLLGRR